MHHNLFRILLVLLFLIATTPLNVQASAPVFAPHFQQIVDVNPCNGETVLITYAGTQRIVESAAGTSIHIDGLVTYNGYSGPFTAQVQIHGDQVFHLQVQDHQFGPEGQAKSHTLVHATIVDGVPKVDFTIVRLDCVGH